MDDYLLESLADHVLSRQGSMNELSFLYRVIC